MSSEEAAEEKSSPKTDESTRIEPSAGEPRDTSTVDAATKNATAAHSSELGPSERAEPGTSEQKPEASEEATEVKKPAAVPGETQEVARREGDSPEVPHVSSSDTEEKPRQVIAVSASKGPAAFFNLARKFLVTDDMCDLSALEGAIVSAVDAAHLLERSKLATIVRIQTSYVTVEPKRKRLLPPSGADAQQSATAATASTSAVAGYPPPQPYTSAGSAMYQQTPLDEPKQYSGHHHREQRSAAPRELRRARIVVTVKRTESYKQWLEDNPVQAILAGDADESSEKPSAASDAPADARKS